ncbi:hypothetical protein ACLVWU_15725 [Bdellovibrio sp. HCB290]|uniref:hypothetical protein n=1 Tax=Bdellovibrio sp. HCB290 TaxID=3394356 RepID=UPI0039B59068
MDSERYKFSLERELAQLKIYRAYFLNLLFWGGVASCMYFMINFGSMLAESSYSFQQDLASSSDERKTYMACVMIMRTINPSATEFSSCEPYNTYDKIKQRKVATVEPVEGECPVGYKMITNFGMLTCKAVSTDK